jgi:hypothetical protein
VGTLLSKMPTCSEIPDPFSMPPNVATEACLAEEAPALPSDQRRQVYYSNEESVQGMPCHRRGCHVPAMWPSLVALLLPAAVVVAAEIHANAATPLQKTTTMFCVVHGWQEQMHALIDPLHPLLCPLCLQA